MIKKTIEIIDTDPGIVISNAAGELSSNGVLLFFHYWTGEDGERLPQIDTETEEAIYLERDDIRSLIEGLQEFLK